MKVKRSCCCLSQGVEGKGNRLGFCCSKKEKAKPQSDGGDTSYAAAMSE